MYPLDVSAMYQLIIGPVNIVTPRSSAPWDSDTLLVSAVARYGPPLPPHDIQPGQPILDGLPDPLHPFDANPGTQIQQVGKVEKGIDLKVGPIVAVGSGLGRHDLIFGPFLSVPGENKELRLGYLLANSSYGNEGTGLTKEMVSTLFDAAAAFLGSYYQGAGLVRTTLSHVMKRVDDVLHGSCDALMGGGAGLMTSIDLLTATSSAGQYRDLDLNQKMYSAGWYFDNVNQFFGEPSFPCNRGEYRARWVIQRTSFKPLM
jgi:hypothetical protein